jgi:hypothetical protein
MLGGRETARAAAPAGKGGRWASSDQLAVIIMARRARRGAARLAVPCVSTSTAMIIARRICAKGGKLEAQGNLSLWRCSEVRLPDLKSESR